MKVLIVEDDESLRLLMAQFLNFKLKIKVSEAGSAEEAIKMITGDNEPTLIVSDYNMPNGNGKKLQDYLVDQKNRSPFIFFSGETEIQLAVNHRHYLGTIAKPNLEKLLVKASEIIAHYVELYKQ